MSEHEELIKHARTALRRGVASQDAWDAFNAVVHALESLPTPPVAGEPEREALADVLAEVEGWSPNGWRSKPEFAKGYYGQADAVIAHLAAGYRRQPEPREVTTVEELDALPGGSVIRDRFHDVMERRGDLWCSFETTPFPSLTVARKYLPATVLFTPSTEES